MSATARISKSHVARLILLERAVASLHEALAESQTFLQSHSLGDEPIDWYRNRDQRHALNQVVLSLTNLPDLC